MRAVVSSDVLVLVCAVRLQEQQQQQCNNQQAFVATMQQSTGLFLVGVCAVIDDGSDKLTKTRKSIQKGAFYFVTRIEL